MTTSPLPLCNNVNGYESMLFKVGSFNNCTKSAFAITSALYLCVAAAAYGYFIYEPNVTKLDIGSPSIALSLEQFGNVDEPTAPSSDETTPAPEEQEQKQVDSNQQQHEIPDPEPLPQPVVQEHKQAMAKAERRHERKIEHRRKVDEMHHMRRDRAMQTAAHLKEPPANAHRQNRPMRSERSSEHVLILGRDQHPVLTQIKQAIDSNLLYPRRARMMREEGAAIVQFTYTRQGQLRRLRLLRSTGSAELDDAAKQTIIRASATFPQVKEDYTLRLPIIFRLTN